MVTSVDFARMVLCFIILILLRQASGLFEECNHILKLEANQKLYINSPYYPRDYPKGTSCRYSVEAPTDYKIKFNCDIKLNTPTSDTRCHHEAFHFNPEGDELLSESEYFCGNGNFERKSFLNRAVISYISKLPNKRTFPQQQQQQVKVGHKVKKDQQASLTNTSKSTTTQKPTTEFASDAGDEDYSQDLTGEVLNAFNYIGMSDALAYVASFLYYTDDENDDEENDDNDEDADTNVDEGRVYGDDDEDVDKSNNSKPIISSVTYLDKLPTLTLPYGHLNGTKTSKTSVKRAKIVSNDGGSVDDANSSQSLSGIGGGRFSCLVMVEAKPSCDCGWSRPQKIATPDTEAGINEFSSMAGLQTKKNKQIFCGATIIHQYYLLSAAHCFQTVETNQSALIQAVVGEHDLTTVFETLYTRIYDITELILHDLFSLSSFSSSTSSSGQLLNDIALLRTTQPITWNRSVGPTCLPWRKLLDIPSIFSFKSFLTGHRLDTAGWGTTSFGGMQAQRLQKTTLDTIDIQRCQQLLGNAVPPHTFCTYTPGKDTCQYDSGGALYDRSSGRLMAVGIVSYGYACATKQPSVNTRIADYLKWIRAKTQDIKYCIL